MSSRVEFAAAPHRTVVRDLRLLSQEALPDLGAWLDEPCPPDRVVRLLAGVVTVWAALANRPGSVRDAVQWFAGERTSSLKEPFALSTIRWTAEPDEHLVALLPYVLDPFGLTTRRGILTGRACLVEREVRKRLGTFYTPGDVARALANDVITADTRCVLDPACGAGVFLRAAFTKLSAITGPAKAVERLWGVDVDAMAIDACALVLTHDWLAREPLREHELPVERFRRTRSRLIATDALELFARPSQSRLFGLATQDPGVRPPADIDAVLTNPPFAPTGLCSERVIDGYQSLRAARNPASVNMMWPFWELASRAASSRGRVGIVLPLSAAYVDGDIARAGRTAVFANGRWELRFFDRTPDALFGDDVKQRVAVAVRREGAPGLVRTTALRRWSADRRAAALSGEEAGDGIDIPYAPGVVLKIGTATELEAVEHLRSLGGKLGDSTTAARLASAAELAVGERTIAVAPTAYNWIGAFRDTRVAVDARRCAAGKLAELTFATEQLADAAYALSVSHVFLWWWRASGDLFHVPLAALAEAPFPLARCRPEQVETLARAGRLCWQAALGVPVTAVNKGIATTAYRPDADCEVLALADNALGRAFGLGPEFVHLVRHDAERLRTAGRTI